MRSTTDGLLICNDSLFYNLSYPWEKMTDREKQLTIDAASAALAIAKRAFAKDIEAAYKEGWDDNDESPHNPSYQRERAWLRSHSRAAILASIPEQHETTRHITTEKQSKPAKVRKTFVVKTVRASIPENKDD